MLLIESSFASLIKNATFAIVGRHLCYLDSNRGSDVTLDEMSDEEEADNSNSCTETGESDDQLVENAKRNFK